MLEVVDIDVSYGPVAALTGVSLKVERGSITSIIGANGAGKSTCLKAISGVVMLDRGSILLEGQPIHQLQAEKRIGHGIAHVMEGRRLFADQTVEDNLLLGAYFRLKGRHARGEVEEDRQAMFRRFPILGQRSRQYAGTMSGGEQQMLAIAVALMAKPRLLLLDEPSLGLAPKMVATIAALIRELRAEGLTILLVEQMASMALNLADVGYAFERGKVRGSGRASDMLRDIKVYEAYFGRAGAES